MEELFQISAKLAGYFGCLAIGALVSWFFTKEHYEKIVNEEVESIRQVQERKRENVKKNSSQPTDEKTYMLDMITEYNYRPKEDVFSEPYLIPMETYDDADPSFEKISLEYYTEDHCLVENDTLIDPDVVGIKNLERFAKRMDLIIMYIRNEKIGVDYEVSKIVAKWSE